MDQVTREERQAEKDLYRHHRLGTETQTYTPTAIRLNWGCSKAPGLTNQALFGVNIISAFISIRGGGKGGGGVVNRGREAGWLTKVVQRRET